MASPLRNFLVTVQMQADFSAVRRETDRNRQQVGQYVRDVQGGMRQAGAAWDGASANIRAQAQVIGTAKEAIRGYFAIVAAQAGPQKLVQYADAWTGINNRLKLVTDSASDFNQAQGRLIDIALGTHQPLTATAELYQRIAVNQDRLGLSGGQVADVVKTISQTLVISGTSASAAQAALVQLGQAFASGTLRGEELNSVLEQAPALAKALADGLGVSTGQLRQLGASGQLTAQQVIAALQKMSGQVDADFGKATTTIVQAFTDLETKTTVYLGKLNEATGAGAGFAQSIGAIADHLDLVAGVLGGAATYKAVSFMAELAAGAGKAAVSTVQQTAAAIANAQAQRDAAAAALTRAEAEKFVQVQALQRARSDEEMAVAAVRAATATLKAAEADAAKAFTDAAKIAANKAVAAATLQVEAAERLATVATEASTAATGRAAAASLGLAGARRAAAAATGGFATAGRAALGLVGGPAGLIALVATAAVGWLMFRDNTNEAASALTDLQTPLDQAIAKFHELDRAQQLKAQHDLAARLDEAKATASRSLGDLYSGILDQTGNSPGYFAASKAIGDIVKQADAGAVSVRDASARIITAIDDIAARTGMSAKQKAVLQDQAAAWAKNAQEVSDYKVRMDAANGTQANATTAAQATTTAIVGQGTAVAKAAQSWDTYLSKLTQAAAAAGLNAEQSAVMAASAAGYTAEQAKLAGNIARQQELFGQYRDAIAKGDQAQADSIAKTLTGLVQTEAALRGIKGIIDGPGVAEAVGKQLKAGNWLDAGKQLFAGLQQQGTDDSKLQSELQKHLAAIAAGTDRKPASAAGHDAQQQAIRDLQSRIVEQQALTVALRDYGLAADKMTDGDKRVARLQLDIAAATDTRKKADLQAQLALAQKLATAEHANAVTRDQLQLAQSAAAAEREMTRAMEDRNRQHARELAAVGLGDKGRDQNSRLQAIDDDYRKRRQSYQDDLDAQRAAGKTVDDGAAATYFAKLDALREADLASERRYQAQLIAAQGDWVNGATRAWENYRDKAADVASQTGDLFTRAFQGMEDSLVSFVTTGKGSFKSLASDILKELVRIEVRVLASQILQSIIGAFMGGASYGGGTGAANGTGAYSGFGSSGTIIKTYNAAGGVYQSPSLSAYSGQIVSNPTVFAFAKGAGVMGEAGPEAIMPLARGSDGKLGVRAAGGGGGVTINQTINVGEGGETTSGAGNQADAARAFADRMKTVARQTIAEEQRPGGSLWRMAHA